MKKAALFLSILMLLALCLMGCGAKEDETDLIVPTGEDGTDLTTTKERTTLVLAGLNCTSNQIGMVINEFNKVNTDYQVVLVDYATDLSFEQGKTKLQTKILSSDPPDMLLFDEPNLFIPDKLSPLPYIGQGLLVDLDPFVAEDPTLSESDFIVWDALHEYGGMYVIGPKFCIDTVYCTQETAEKYKGWTLEDYIELQNSLDDQQDLFYTMSPEEFILRIGSRYLSKAIDYDAATCDFENPEFLSLLETAYNAESYDVTVKHTQPDGSFKSVPEMMMDGELLFCSSWLLSATDVAFDRYRSGGERMGYIGWPTPDGSSGTDINLCTPVAICAGSKEIEGCWEFIKYALQNPIYQDAQDGTPVLESLLEDNFKSIIANSDELPFMSNRKDQDVIVELAKTSKTMSFYNEDVLSIVQEEAEAFLDGTATLEEVAARIQSRASILVSERYG